MATDNILVAIKSRPLITRERSEKLRPQWNVQEEAIFQIDEEGRRLGDPYSFDHIFTEEKTNTNVYNSVVEPLVISFLNGFNSTIFAYGQTSSGKTHTMMGSEDVPGIIQMAINDVFNHVSHNNQRRYLISCSYFEIYNEKINDLLDKNGQDLKIREDYCGNTFVNAKEEVVTRQAQVFALMKEGSKIRKIGCTNMNERSSRSHTIFRLTIKSTENNIEHGSVQISHLNLVDLAGSERITHTKAEGVRRKEGVNINKSLLALGNVIRQLSDGEGFINYRDSNLTRLLQSALGGNAKSLIIATITVAAGEETKSTLEFAQRAKVVKNKPIVNEILSEQDKLKQYELVTASYKDRLEKEKQRIQEMEQEKEEREREISKLKQQVKLIDLFTKGPDLKKTDSKIPRRHTMGHYTPRMPLQTIQESKMLSSNVPEKLFDPTIKNDPDDEYLFLETASRLSDYDSTKIISGESLECCTLLASPTTPRQVPLEEGTTPVLHLRKRLQHLEESYTSLQEFTKLEAECKEDTGRISELRQQNENLLKDITDLNFILKDIKQEKKQMEARFEEKLATLESDMGHLKKRNDDLMYALEEAETEKDILRLAKEQLLNDSENLLEQQKLKHENQIQYFIKEIERLNGVKESLLKNEIDNIKSEYEEKIVILEKQLEKFKKEEEVNIDILCVSTQTDDVTLDMKEALRIKLSNATDENIQREYDNLEKTVQTLNDELQQMRCLNLALEEELHSYKEKTSSLSEIEIINNNMKEDMIQKQDEINALLVKVQNLENDSQHYKHEIKSKDTQILEILNKMENLEGGIRDKNEEITTLLDRIKNLEETNQIHQEKIDFQTKEIESKNECLEKTSGNYEEQILSYTEQIRLKDNDICNLEESNLTRQEKIDFQAREIDSTNEKIIDLRNKIEYLEKTSQNYEDKILSYEEQIRLKDNEICNLYDRIKKLEETNQTCQGKINFQTKEIESRNENLKKKIECLENTSQTYENKILSYKEQIRLKDNDICNLEESNLTRQEKIDCQSRELESTNEKIIDLRNKIEYLEKTSQNYENKILSYEEQIHLKDNEICNLLDSIKKLEETNQTCQGKINFQTKEIESRNENLKKKIECLENTSKTYENKILSYKEQIRLKDNDICNLEESNLTRQEKIDCQARELESTNEKIIDLRNKIEWLEKTSQNYEDKILSYEEQIRLKDNEICNLLDRIKKLEETNQTCQGKINFQTKEIELRNENLEKKIECLENTSQTYENKILSYKEDIRLKDNEINNLLDRIKTLEATNQICQGKIDSQTKEIELRNENLKKKMERYEKNCQTYENKILSYKEQILLKDNDISHLFDCIKKLEETNQICQGKIDSQTKEIELRNENLKKKIERHEKTSQIYENKILSYKEQIRLKDNEINNLLDCIKKLEATNQTCTEKIDLQTKEIESGNKNIIDLRNKIECLEQTSRNNEGGILPYKEQIRMKDNQICNLTHKIDTLETKIRNMCLETVPLKTRIFDLENVIAELKSSALTEKLEPASTYCSSPSDLSPKEIRRRKRQSIHDQRRGIDFSESDGADGYQSVPDKWKHTENELKEKINKLEAKIEYLSNENDRLKIMSELRKYKEQEDKAIEMLEKKIEEVTKGKGFESCKDCTEKRDYVKKLEGLQKQNQFKIVDLQTKIYDLQNSYTSEKTHMEEKERRLCYHVAKLEEKLKDRPAPKDAEIQCDMMNYEQLRQKYSCMKNLARMRRNEANILRAKLGLNPDEPVT